MLATLSALLLMTPPSTPPVVVEDTPKPSVDPTTIETVLRPERLGGPQGRTVGDLLRLSPGLQLRQHGGIGSRQTVLMRGTDSQQALILLGDVRLNPATGGGVDLSVLPLAAIDRVEVYRGGGGALFGSDAIGGVIRIVPRSPPPRAHTGGTSHVWIVCYPRPYRHGRVGGSRPQRGRSPNVYKPCHKRRVCV